MLTQSGHGLIINTDSINSVASKNGKGVSGIKLDKKMEDDKVIGVLMNVNTENSIKLKTEKGKEMNINLSDISPDKDKNYFQYIFGVRSNLGNFIYNTRSNKDKVIKIDII